MSANSGATVAFASFPPSFCIAGRVRRPARGADWWEDALLGGGNGGLVVHLGDGSLWHPLAAAQGGWIAVGRTTEGLKLDFALSCGRHLRRCTPHAVQQPRHLLCRFCTSDSDLKRARRERPSGPERAMFTMLAVLRPGREWRWQVCPPLPAPARPKPLDFMHVPTAIYLEVDGKQHFSGGMHGVPCDEQQRIDVEWMQKLWAMGAALVRVHHADVGPAAVAVVRKALALREAGSTGPLLLLTPSYNPGPAVAHGRVLDPWAFINALQGVLGAATRTIDSNGAVCFWPGAPLTM